MSSDFFLILLLCLVLLLIFLSIKYFKVLLFYLWIFLWVFLWIFWKSILIKSWLNFDFINNLFINFKFFFNDSVIISFFTENIKLLLILTTALVFYKVTYYLILIFIHFINWSSVSLLNWIWNKKEKKSTLNSSSENTDDN